MCAVLWVSVLNLELSGDEDGPCIGCVALSWESDDERLFVYAAVC